MLEADLLKYLKEHYPKENEKCEWKAFSNLTHNVSGQKGEDVISYVSAIANASGGVLIMGVEDATLKILGIKNFHDYTSENLPARLMGNCTNLSSEGLFVEDFTTSDTHLTIWILHIPKHNARKPIFAHKKAWQRKGDTLIEMVNDREQTILNEPLRQNDDWSAVICNDATIDDLEPKAIDKARANYKNKFPELASEVDSWDDATFLNKAKVTIKGKITRAAIILLGKTEAEHFINPAEAKIRWILKDNNNVERDYLIRSCPLLLEVDVVFQKIRNLKYRYLKSGTIFPDEVEQYEPFIIREALNNCIAHQDYSNGGGRINLVEQNDELIFTNIGTFIPGSIENVIRNNAPEELYRNPFLVTAMYNLQMVDTIGSGIRRMFNFQRVRFFPMPEYDFSNGKVKVTITGKVLDMEYARALAQNPQLTLDEIILLDNVQKKKSITDSGIKHLRDKKLIEGKKGAIHISADLAASTGQTVEYMKTKGVDDAFIKKTITDYLIKFGSAKRQVFEQIIANKLSDSLTDAQKKIKIKHALQALRKNGTIIQNNERKWILKQNS